jgi:hypothetical protein
MWTIQLITVKWKGEVSHLKEIFHVYRATQFGLEITRGVDILLEQTTKDDAMSLQFFYSKWTSKINVKEVDEISLIILQDTLPAASVCGGDRQKTPASLQAIRVCLFTGNEMAT